MWIFLTTCITLSILSLTSQTKGNQTTCGATAVVRGETAAVTCNFGDDISKLQKDIKIIHYLENNRNAAVMSCHWTGGALKCNLRPTYILDGDITDTLRVLIPDAQTTHAGNYACFIIPAEGVHLCYLAVRDINTSCDAPSVRSGESATLTCHFSENVDNLHRRIKVQHYTSLTLSKSDNVLICDWSLNSKWECNNRPTYIFDNIITDKLVIQIPQANQGHNGSYVCFVMPAAPDTFKLCSLLIEENLSLSESALTRPSIFPITSNCMNASSATDINHTHCLGILPSGQETSDNSIWKILTGIFSTVTVVLIMVIIFLKRKEIRCNGKEHSCTDISTMQPLQSASSPKGCNTEGTSEKDLDTV